MLRPSLKLGAQNQFGDLERNVSASLLGVSGRGFTVGSARVAPTAAVADASVRLSVSRRFDLTVDLRGRASRNQTDASAGVGGVFRF